MRTDTSLLQAALIGYEVELKRIEQAISDLRRKLRNTASNAAAAPISAGLQWLSDVKKEHGRRWMSEAAKKRIAKAQKKRWAAYRKSKKAASAR
jgi:hypothetical protein